MPVRSLVPSDYYPTSPRSGNEGTRVFRMRNMILRGTIAEPYAEVYGGSLDLGENIPDAPITGTVTCTANVAEVVGAGTAFKTELHLGQRLEVYGGAPALTIPLVVDFITDDTHFTACRVPYASTAGANCTRAPRMFEVNKKRGTLIWGNGVEFDLGTLIAVGSGVFRLNGAVLPGTSLTATRTPQIAIFDPTTGNYSVYPLGMATPASLTAAEIGGGIKAMQPGIYSVRAVPARTATKGYNNPSVKAQVTITVAGNKIRLTVPAADTTSGQDAWMFFVTLLTGGQDADGNAQGINGPWYRYQPNVASILVEVGPNPGQIPAAGGTYDIEYNDAEVSDNDLLSFDNDAPSAAEFVAALGGRTTYISTDGPGNTSPGPFISPVKSNNIEAAPARLKASPSPPDTIIGYKIAPRRVGDNTVPGLYLLCTNTLQIGVATGAADPRLPVLSVSQYWASGFKNPDCLAFVDNYLLGMTNNGLARSLNFGDEGSEEFGFATAMVELFQDLNPGHALIAIDPKNNAACLFDMGHSLNSSGFWTTRVWMYGMRENKWIGDILLTSTSTDMLVTGVATVNGRLEFLCGGRTGAGTVFKTYRFDEPSASEDIPYYIAWQFSDWGVEDRPKHVGPFFQIVSRLSAGFLGGSAGIYGAEPGDVIPVAKLEAGDHSTSKSGTILISSSTDVAQANVIELNIDNLKQFTVRIDGEWFGGAGIIRDRIDEVIIQAEVMGSAR